MNNDQIEITMSKEKLKEMVRAYEVLGDFLNQILPKDVLYKKNFLHGLDEALKQVETGQSRKIQTFDEFIK